MISSKKHLEILKEYDILRDNSRKELDARLKLVYNNVPEIKKIDDEINLTSIKLAKSIISIPREKREEFIYNLKNKNNMLLENKKKLLLENGFSEDYLQYKYHCIKCEDTGYLDNEKCDCFKQKIIDKVYDMYKLKEQLEYENFEKFNFNIFSKEFTPENLMSPYDNIRLIFKSAQNFVKDFDVKFENIVFYGNTGSGKTFLCNCIAKDLLDKGKTVIYNTAFEIFDLVEKRKFNKIENNSENAEELEFITEADLLIIDDLGTEFITILSSSELFNIINMRILNKKSTIISTNLDPDSLLNQYSSRVISRFYGHYEMVKVFNSDIRMSKDFKK